jgi:hypothetical protein
MVNPDTVDVGILVLDSPINLPWYPSLASAPVDEGSTATNVGRIKDGVLSRTALYYGRDVALHPGQDYGFPLSYISRELIEPGDSGGPVYIKGANGRTIVAVNSGAGGGTQTLARVDLVKKKIDQIIAESGGPGDGNGSTPTPGNTTCSGAAEAEPNDYYDEANPLSDARCGKLTAGDVDWFTWDVSRAGVSYDLELHTSGDAELLMWKETAWGWQRIQNASPTQFAALSVSGSAYLVAVASPSKAAQPYKLTLKK